MSGDIKVHQPYKIHSVYTSSISVSEYQLDKKPFSSKWKKCISSIIIRINMPAYMKINRNRVHQWPLRLLGKTVRTIMTTSDDKLSNVKYIIILFHYPIIMTFPKVNAYPVMLAINMAAVVMNSALPSAFIVQQSGITKRAILLSILFTFSQACKRSGIARALEEKKKCNRKYTIH